MYSCLHCLNTDCVELKNDKKGRPYTTCRMCSTRSFMHSSMALRGLTHFAPQLIAMWREATSASSCQRQLDAIISNQQRIAEGIAEAQRQPSVPVPAPRVVTRHG